MDTMVARHLSPCQVGRDECSMVRTNSVPKTRIIRLYRQKGSSNLGLSIRGGREHGIGIYVSDIEPGSEAHLQGLQVGDEIVQVNGWPLTHAIHKEVTNILKSHNDLTLHVRNIGLLPVKDRKEDPLMWKFIDASPSSPSSKKTSSSTQSSPNLDDFLEMKIFIDMNGHTGLGCSICKGPKERPGIFVQSVKEGGLAQHVGLQVGDQIALVDGLDFSNVDFQETVKYLKAHRQLEFLVRKGAGSDLFPGESSGYNSSSSSVNGEGSNHEDQQQPRPPSRDRERLPSVQEEIPLDGFRRRSPDSEKVINVTEEKTEEVTEDETVTTEKEEKTIVHETMEDNMQEDGPTVVIEERQFRETVTHVKRVVTTVDVHQNDVQADDETEEAVVEGIRRVAEEEIQKNAEREIQNEKQEMPISPRVDKARDAQTQTMENETVEFTEDDEHTRTAEKVIHVGLPTFPIDARSYPSKAVEEMQKKQQHDLLIEEFKRVRKSMFEPEESNSANILPPPQGWESKSDTNNGYQVKTQTSEWKTTTETTTETLTEDFETERVSRRQRLPKELPMESPRSNEVLYIDVRPTTSSPNIRHSASPNRLQPQRSSQSSPLRRSPSPSSPDHITDSRFEIPKPPKFFFPKEEKRKPLVTIGTYQSRPEPGKFEFLRTPPQMRKGDVNQELNQVFRNAESLTSDNVTTVIHNGPHKSTAFIHTNGTAQQNGSSSPTLSKYEKNKLTIQVPGDVTSTKKTTVQVGSVPPQPKPAAIFKQQTTRQLEPTTSLNKRISFEDYPIIIEELPRNSQALVEDFNPLKLFTEAQIAGRQVKMYTIPKANPMDIMIEGGYGSSLGGRIIVSAIREGGEIYKQGIMNKGDQIMWINGVSLIDITQSQAHGVMREAAKNYKEPLKIIIAKAPPGLFDDV